MGCNRILKAPKHNQSDCACCKVKRGQPVRCQEKVGAVLDEHFTGLRVATFGSNMQSRHVLFIPGVDVNPLIGQCLPKGIQMARPGSNMQESITLHD